MRLVRFCQFLDPARIARSPAYNALWVIAFASLTVAVNDVAGESAAGGTESLTSLYDAASGPVKGWSHIVTHPEHFPLIAHEPSRYAVDASSMVSEEQGAGAPFFRTILVRKMSDWNQQHANGVEPVFFDHPLSVDEVEAVRLLIKFNSDESTIPSVRQLDEHYGPYLSEEQIEGLDRGLACLSLTFVGAGYNDQVKESLKAIYYVVFDPETDFDHWMELVVPLDKFSFGYEKNYSMRSIDRSETLGQAFVGFRINPETTGGIVARNYFGDKWDETVPELYKEMSISLSRIEVLRSRPQGMVGKLRLVQSKASDP